MAFPLLPIHVLCFFAKSLDQFVKWHLSVCVCLGPELRAPTRTHLCRYSSPSPGRTISGLKRDACSRLVCGGLLRVCHYPGYNLHALWWGPFIQLSFPPPLPSHPNPSPVPTVSSCATTAIHPYIHGRCDYPCYCDKKVTCHFFSPSPPTGWPLMPGYLRTFFMILLAAKTSNFATMFIG